MTILFVSTEKQIVTAYEMTATPEKKVFTKNIPIIQIPFEEEFNTVVIPITINGSQKLRCILDTGMPGGVFLLDPKTAKNIDLKYVSTNVTLRGSGSGTQLGSMAMGTTVQVDKIKLSNQRVIVLNEPGSLAKIGVDGAIGASIFNKYVVQMDFEKKLLLLFSVEDFDAKQLGEEFSLEIVNTKPFIKAKVSNNEKQNVPVSLLLDTGAGAGLSLHTKSLSELILPKRTIKGVLGGGVGGDIVGKLGRISTLQLGKHKLKQIVTGFPETANTNSDGTIGMEILNRFLITIDYTNNRMFLLPNKSFNDVFEFNMSGIAVKPTAEGKLGVRHVFDGSPGSQAGIRSGDIIIAVNGKKLNFSGFNQMADSFKKQGKKMTIIFERNGKQQKTVLKLRRLL